RRRARSAHRRRREVPAAATAHFWSSPRALALALAAPPPPLRAHVTHTSAVIFRAARVRPAELEQVTGWGLKPEGLCREDRCVPFNSTDPEWVDLAAIAQALCTPLVHDARHGLWALGAQASGRALPSASAPDLELPDVRGAQFRLSSLRGRKVLLVAWAS